jgi:hypothetical protein
MNRKLPMQAFVNGTARIQERNFHNQERKDFQERFGGLCFLHLFWA